jgi:6-pyruvoyltetrahydropterin/6-carboxytetrahydropterin synthase
MKQPFIELTKEISFEAAHYLHNPKWNRKKNIGIFKKCSGFRADDPKASQYPHGHSYRLRVTVKGPVHPETGFVIDFKSLKEILRREVFERLDHRFINKEVEPFKNKPGIQPTVENLLLVIWDRLAPVLKKTGVELHEVVLWETQDNFASYRGGE